jgi:malate dehydrogenase (oxaloacetate-decarboxylating)(NADP+)
MASECKTRGIQLIRDPKLNKGMAFSVEERQVLGIHGLLPPVVFSQEEQVERVLDNVRHWDNDLDKYIYLTALQDRNESLFYKVITENIEEMAPIIYTPTVGLACQKFGFIFRKPRGLYITINDLGHVDEILANWPEPDVQAIVVTDGERILGLGDLGAFGMGIPCGKLSLYTAMGRVPPSKCLPVVIDVGTDNEKLLQEKVYIGLRHKRVRGQKYDKLIEEFMQAVVQRYGNDTLIQFEDFANNNAFRLLEKYRNQYLTFNDDIQGTASVAVAGVIAAMRITKTKLSDHTYLFQGAGEASIGIANLLVMAMKEEGTSEEDALAKIWMVDSKGLITKNREDANRPSGGMTSHKAHFAKDFEHIERLEDVCRAVKPSVAIGAAAVPGAFTPQFLKDMASFNERPIIFALSNPTSKAECTAEQAYNITEGRCIFATGSPFSPVTVNGQTFVPGQGNNAYIFPGVAFGAILSAMYHINDAVFLRASQALAEMVTDQHLKEGRVYPPLSNIVEVSTRLATRIVEYAYETGSAGRYPEPKDKEAFVRANQYNHDYDTYLPTTYAWPNHNHNGRSG